jgi:hypothetical protein
VITHVFLLSPSNSKRGVNRRATQNKAPKSKQGRPAQASSSLLTNHHIGGMAGRVRVPDDLTRRPMSFLLTQTPPMQIRNQLHWFETTLVNTTLSVSSTGITEYNQTFSFNGLSNYAAYTAVFDQYCIHSILASFAITSSADYFSGSQGRMTTALDFDNITNLGSEATLQQYGSAITVEVTPGLSVERYIKPTVKGYISAGSGAYAGVPERVWLDCTLPTIQHYGIRAIFAGNTESSLICDITNTYIIGFRNTL